jgi:hypothetical protein
MGRPLKIAKAQAVITVTATNGTTEVVTTSANFTNLGIIAGMPFVIHTTTGGLTAGTTYWILQVINAGANSTFTVSATPLNANPTNSPVNLSTAGPVTVLATIAPVDAYFNNPNGGDGYPATNANTYSVVGGNTAIYGTQVLTNVCIGLTGVGTITVADDSPNIDGVGTDLANTLTDGTIVYNTDGAILGVVDDIANANAEFATFAANATANASGIALTYGNPEAGFIVRQKGKQKYLVTGTTSGLTGACYTANVANTAMLANTMTITATYANASTVLVQSLSDHTAELFTSTSGVTATETDNINNASPAFSTFNTAYAANTYGGQPYPIVTIGGA